MQNRIVIFDLDGTIYQNSVFHRGYLRTLVAGTWAEPLEADLVRLAEAIFAGRELDMNRFYRRGRAEAATVPELVQALRKRVLPNMTYAEALKADDVVYLGDAWAVLAYLGDALGCLDGDRANEVYRLTRLQMEQTGMHGDRGLYEAIMRLEQRCRVVLLSNSYEETVREFLRQLGFAGAFREICSSANKPYGMIASLQALDPALLVRPEALISIGDHAFNDLMPISAIGGRKLQEKEPLSPVREVLGYGVFAVVIICLMLGFSSWQVTLAGAIVLVVTGVLTEREAIDNLNLSTVLLYVGVSAFGEGLAQTGAAEMVGDAIAKVLEGVTNGYIIGFVFYMVSFLMTSLLYNRAVSTVLTPVAVITCTSIGCDPRGPVILCALATMSSLITPMATAVVPMAMDAGGYSAKTMFKVGILPGILRGVVGTLIAMTLFPM